MSSHTRAQSGLNLGCERPSRAYATAHAVERGVVEGPATPRRTLEAGRSRGTPAIVSRAVKLVLIPAVLLLLASAAAAAGPARWAGLSRSYVEAIATKGDRDYDLDASSGEAPFHSLRAGMYKGRPAWIVRLTLFCAGGHVPTMILSAAKKPYRPGGYDYVCKHARGDLVACVEPTTC